MATDSPSREHIADSLLLRAALRREKLAARVALDADTHASLSTRIGRHLAAFLTALPPQTLAFCAPVRGECDVRPLVSMLIESGWRVAMPVVEAANAPMSFRIWTPTSAMSIGRHGIPVPADGEPVVPEVVLLPLVAFDSRGYRLGYGGGYFDRTLGSMVPRPMTIGVGFELARVPDIRPQTHDVPVDVLVTEAGSAPTG